MKSSKLKIKSLIIMSLVLLPLVFAYFAMQTSAAPDEIFSGGFESGDFSNWSSVDENWTTPESTSTAHTGTFKAKVIGNVSNANLLKNRSTAGYENIRLSYWWRTSGDWEADDTVLAEWTDDGSTWQTLQTISEGGENTSYTQESHNLAPSANNNDSFAMRFSATLSASNEVFYLDDVLLEGDTVNGEPTATPTPEEEIPTPEEPTPAPEEPTPEPGKPAFWGWFREFMRSVFERQRQMFERIWG